MNVILKTPPVLEPVTLVELKEHLKIESETLAENVGMYTSIVSGSYSLNSNYTLIGAGVSVFGKESIVYLQPVDNGTGGTVDVKIQESEDNITYFDWTGGAFTQVAEANDTVIQEKQYTGTKSYIRVVAKVLVAASEFGVDILVKDSLSSESSLLTSINKAARKMVENTTRRQLITSTWEYYLNKFPPYDDYITIPFGNLQTVTSIKYKNCDWTSVADDITMTEGTDYIVELNGEGCGRIVLPYSVSWPGDVLYPSNPITINFTCGYGATGASIDDDIKAAIKLVATDLYINKEGQILGISLSDYKVNKTVMSILSSYILREEF